MNREIKFRIYSPASEKMSHPFYLNQQMGINSDSIIMQHTSLKDKNGKEIYEGDLNQDKGVVIWNESDASFCWDYKGIEVMPMGEENEWCEVIGNIYENPELIK